MKIITVVGARPQFIKAAAVCRAISQHNRNSDKKITHKIIHTGQHYDENMSDVFFNEMDIPFPDFNIGVAGVSHGEMTGRMLVGIEKILMNEKPDLVMVFGDTNSTLAGALAASKLNIKVAHVEAGLRSFNRSMPEETNRMLTDCVSDLLFCPTELAVSYLVDEGIDKRGARIELIGDVMYDAARYYQTKSVKPDIAITDDKPFVLVTCHRAENTNVPTKLAEIVNALNVLSERHDIVFSLHPRTLKKINEYGLTLMFSPYSPFSYFEMLWLLKHCQCVLTDSGGLQKEAYFFSKYCLILREETEWKELLESGMSQLINIDKDVIVNQVDELMGANRGKNSQSNQLYGDGNASKLLVDFIVNL